MKSVLILSLPSQSSGKSFVDFNHPKFEGASLTNIQIDDQFLDQIKNLTASSFDEAYVFIIPDSEILSLLFNALRPNAKLLIETCISSREEGQSLCTELQLHGFMDTMIAKDPVSGDRFVTCSKPSWGTGEVATIKLPQKADKAAWKMSTEDLAEDDLVDEDELLDDNLEITVGAGCGIDPTTGKRIGNKKACKNCSCGLRELEQEEMRSAQVESTPSFNSSCGSCYKGDAFRCASCPFLGKPAFEPTEENKRVMLAMGSDDI